MSEKEMKLWMEEFANKMNRNVNSTMRWYLGLSFSIILALGGFIGWVAKDHLVTKEQVQTLKIDFGYTSKALAGEHPGNDVFEENAKNYSNARGGG